MKKGKTERVQNKEMDQRSSPVPGFDDIIFEHRNKEYGAYQLRKKYNSVVIAGILVASVLVILAVLIPFFVSSKADRAISVGSYYFPVRMENLEPPAEKIFVPPAAPPAEATRVQESVKYVPPVVVDSLVPVRESPPTVDEVLKSDKLTVANSIGAGLGDDLLKGEGGTNNDDALFEVEVMPSFKGGDLTKFREWVQKHTNYPQAAIEKRIRGTVYLTFIVEKDGSVSNVTVIKGVNPLLDNEAVKAISSSPKWSPGLQRGQPVRVRFQIPLMFQV